MKKAVLIGVSALVLLVTFVGLYGHSYIYQYGKYLRDADTGEIVGCGFSGSACFWGPPPK